MIIFPVNDNFFLNLHATLSLPLIKQNYVKTYSINLSFNRYFSGAPASLLTAAVEAVTSLLASTSGDKRTILVRENQHSTNVKKMA